MSRGGYATMPRGQKIEPDVRANAAKARQQELTEYDLQRIANSSSDLCDISNTEDRLILGGLLGLCVELHGNAERSATCSPGQIDFNPRVRKIV